MRILIILICGYLWSCSKFSHIKIKGTIENPDLNCQYLISPMEEIVNIDSSGNFDQTIIIDNVWPTEYIVIKKCELEIDQFNAIEVRIIREEIAHFEINGMELINVVTRDRLKIKPISKKMSMINFGKIKKTK